MGRIKCAKSKTRKVSSPGQQRLFWSTLYIITSETWFNRIQMRFDANNLGHPRPQATSTCSLGPARQVRFFQKSINANLPQNLEYSLHPRTFAKAQIDPKQSVIALPVLSLIALGIQVWLVRTIRFPLTSKQSSNTLSVVIASSMASTGAL